jgi:hypothetical protein
VKKEKKTEQQNKRREKTVRKEKLAQEKKEVKENEISHRISRRSGKRKIHSLVVALQSWS